MRQSWTALLLSKNPGGAIHVSLVPDFVLIIILYAASEPSCCHSCLQLPLIHRLRDIAAAMAYLHSCNIIHCDLKTPNVLLATDADAPYGQTAKVTDFGLSRALQIGQTHRSTRTLGTVTHMAPELLRSGKLSAAADVYSFGIMSKPPKLKELRVVWILRRSWGCGGGIPAPIHQ